MTDLDKEIARHRKALNLLQEQKRKSKRPKVKSERPRGRPSIDDSKIEQARELAKIFPITDVALQLEIGLTTLYRRGIKRYNLPALKS